MKNILISILIFVIMVFAICFSAKYLDNTCDELLKLNNTMEKTVLKGNWDNAYKMSVSILNKWENEYSKLSIFVHHAQIDDLNNEFLQLTQYTKCKDTTESLSKIHIIKFYLNNIIEQQKINIQNIF